MSSDFFTFMKKILYYPEIPGKAVFHLSLRYFSKSKIAAEKSMVDPIQKAINPKIQFGVYCGSAARTTVPGLVMVF